MLQKMLSQEEKVHEILEAVHNGNCHGSAISIPSFFPPKVNNHCSLLLIDSQVNCSYHFLRQLKHASVDHDQMKGLLTELGTVEAEINRLEHQISSLQHTLKHEHECNNFASRPAQQPQQSVNGRPPAAPGEMYLSFPSPVNGNIVPERMAFETKAMHFISKAIKGDYNLKDFKVVSNPRSLFSDHKENEDAKFLRQTGRILKPSSSPFRDPRHPTPKVCRLIDISY